MEATKQRHNHTTKMMKRERPQEEEQNQNKSVSITPAMLTGTEECLNQKSVFMFMSPRLAYIMFL